jgi:hypothetical protein
MPLVRDPQCLRCGSTLPLNAALRVAPSYRFWLLPLIGKIGIKCGHCGATYRIVQPGAGVAVLLIWIAVIVALSALPTVAGMSHYEFAHMRAWWPLLLVITLVGTAFFLIKLCVRKLTAIRLAEPDEQLYFPLKST